MNRVLNHLPKYYEGIKEFRELSQSQSNELDKLDTSIQQVEDDQFVLTSSESAIYRREKELKILPDKTVETLDFRKKRVLARMQSNPPYTRRYLKVLLNGLLGENRHTINMDVLLYELEVLVDVDSASFYTEVMKVLERIVPLNMTIQSAVILLTEYLILQGSSYTFDVQYKRTGRFRTAPIDGKGKAQTINYEAKSYTFNVEYRRCGKFRAGGVRA